jgi:succinyl-diaminopimelate desuccinylase
MTVAGSVRPSPGVVREAVKLGIESRRADVLSIARRLLSVPSEYPPGDTIAIVDEITHMMSTVKAIEIICLPGAPHIMNVALRVCGRQPGRRLILNGHLDTFPLGDRAAWRFNPEGEEREGRLYGLGVSDMKGGVAAILFALIRLADVREQWNGELVATLAGDEESMGVLGSKLMLDQLPIARGDAMISADAGSPRVLRFGEKGMIWLKLRARGRAAHAAHVHKGDSAIEKLLQVIGEMQKLRAWRVDAPASVMEAIDAAASVSEQLSGIGESEVLKSVTVTFGTIHGGRLSNLIADSAEATADIRLPVGVSVSEIEAEIERMVASVNGIECEISRRYEPSWTVSDHEMIQLLKRNCAEYLGTDPVVNMRVGASDARHYRAAGVPTVVCGLTPNNMGAADEYVEMEELKKLGEIFAMAAFDYLTSQKSSPN